MTLTPAQRLAASVAAALSASLAAGAAGAAELQLSLEIPPPDGGRWHKPYVAVWLESAKDKRFVADLAVWYDVRKRNNAGAKWLNDLRAWWRASGSQAQLPIDGVTGATRGPGDHVLSLADHPALKTLPTGQYEVVVEAAREHGGHDLVRVPLQWPPQAAQQAQAQGSAELGAVRLSAKP